MTCQLTLLEISFRMPLRGYRTGKYEIRWDYTRLGSEGWQKTPVSFHNWWCLLHIRISFRSRYNPLVYFTTMFLILDLHYFRKIRNLPKSESKLGLTGEWRYLYMLVYLFFSVNFCSILLNILKACQVVAISAKTCFD